MPCPEEVAQDAAGQLGRGGFPLRRFLEEPQGGQRLPVNALGYEDPGQLPGQGLDLGRPALLQEQLRLFEKGQRNVVER